MRLDKYEIQFKEDFEKRKNSYLSRKLKEDMSESEETIAIASIINSRIQTEWERIDAINSDIIAADQILHNDNLKNLLQDMLKDSYTHIGQLEKLLTGTAPEAIEIETGKADESDIEEPVEEAFKGEVKILNKTENELNEVARERERTNIRRDNIEQLILPDDDIPEEIAKNINFGKKSEE